MGYKIEWAGSPNYTPGRGGHKIIAIVDHITAGLMPGTLSWMRNPIAKASAHYLVTRDGKIYQMVNDADTSWHAGFVNRPSWKLYDGSNPNAYTIGIEHENIGGGQLTDAQYRASLWLHRYLIDKHNIPVDRNHIIGHFEIDAVNRPSDPGKHFPWERLITDLRNGVLDMALDKRMVDGGREALNFLEKRGMVLNAADWGKEEKLGSATPQYLFWMMMQRLAERMEGK